MRKHNGHKMVFLISDFKGLVGHGEYCRLYSKAMKCIESCDVVRGRNYMRQMKWRWCSRCLEHRLLKAMLAFAQATKHDYGKVLVTFQKMRREVHALVVESTEMRSSKYVGSLYFRILYHIANLHYYMEHDNRSLLTFKECLVVARQSRIERRLVDDIAHKIASLEFMLFKNGLRRLEKFMRKGCFDDARNMLDDTIRNCGIDYIDHGVLALAAMAYFATGNIRRGRQIADDDFEFSANCLETRFVYAIAHIDDRNGKKKKNAYDILLEISGAHANSSCVIGVRKRKRIETLARFVVEVMSEKHGRFKVENHLEFVQWLRDVVVFVECSHYRRHFKSGSVRATLTRVFKC